LAQSRVRDFEAFLAELSHDKRKKIRQERRKVAEGRRHACGRVTGHEATSADWDFFTACYRRTYRAHRSTPYLNRAFFGCWRAHARQHDARDRRARRQARRRRAEPPSQGALYGRYWGATEFVAGLHFEACY
jgi:predicted N-acyltransferase